MADAATAIKLTLEHEGGYQDNPNDHANWSSDKIGEGQLIGTKYGITPADMPGTNIADITPEQATEYYREHYWKSLYSEIESQDVANKLFDLGVLFGVGEAVKILQIVLQHAYPELGAPDEIFGQRTLEYVNKTDPASLLSAYKTAFVAYALRIAANRPSERIFVAGWGKRINS